MHGQYFVVFTKLFIYKCIPTSQLNLVFLGFVLLLVKIILEQMNCFNRIQICHDASYFRSVSRHGFSLSNYFKNTSGE